MTSSFGDHLRVARQGKRLTQAALAEKLGVTRAAVGLWETGTNQPAMKQMLVLWELFGTDFLTREIKPQIQKRKVHPQASNNKPPSSHIFIMSAKTGGELGGESFLLLQISHDEICGTVRRPKHLEFSSGLKAFRLPHDGLSPRFEEEELVIFDENRNPKILEYALVKLPSDDALSSLYYVGRLMEKNADSFVLRQHQPPVSLRLAMNEIDEISRIVPWEEVVGN